MADYRPPMDAETRALERPADHESELRLWLRLLTCSSLVTNEIRSRLRERFATTLPRFDLMSQLEKTTRGLTLGELSQRMMVSNGNMTGLVDTLCGQGLLERVDHGGDRRVVCVRLTATGRETFEVMAAAHAEWIAGMMQDLSDADIADLMRLLVKMKLSVRGMIDEYID